MIEFSSKKLRRRGNVYTLPAHAEDRDGQFVVITGNREKDTGKMQVYCIATSEKKGPVILSQSRGAIPAFNALVEINRQLTMWHNTKPFPKKDEVSRVTRQRIKTIMKFAKLMGIDDLVADKTEFEAHFG